MCTSHLLCGEIVGVIETSTCCVAIDKTVIIELAAEPEVVSVLRASELWLLLVVATWLLSIAWMYQKRNMQ